MTTVLIWIAAWIAVAALLAFPIGWIIRRSGRNGIDAARPVVEPPGTGDEAGPSPASSRTAASATDPRPPGR